MDRRPSRDLPTAEPTLDERWAESRAPLVERLRDEIEAGGPITFARFMDVALYDPDEGYYRTRDDRATRAGDFLTAPEMDPIFGAALGRQLRECWVRLGRPGLLVVRDEGAGSGALGAALLAAARDEDDGFLDALRYLPVERGRDREAAIRDRLVQLGLGAALADPADAGIPLDPGVVVANELLDALPVHRVGIEAGRLRERFVSWRDGWFAEIAGEPSTPRLEATLAAAGVMLREGQCAEICLAAQDWIEALSRSLARGYAIVIDYGLPAGELYGPQRDRGLLRTYRGHHAGDDPFRAVGEQDLTAHVELTTLERVARAAGLMVLGRTTQAELMAGLDAGELLVELGARPDITTERYRTARATLMRLLDPSAMGSFAVLVLGRGVAAVPPLRGLAYRLPARA